MKKIAPVRAAYFCAAAVLGLTVVVVAAGCHQDTRVSAPPIDPQERFTRLLYPTLHNTVGEFAVLADSNPIVVEGYGVVAYLPHTGSGDADPRIRDMLINQLLIKGVGEYSSGLQNISPEKILASNDISVVEVKGVIPPLARRGTAFDLYINALPDSGTTSLANGLLWTTELKRHGLTLNGDDSATIAEGRGPVFIPETLEAVARGKPEDAPKALRKGRVIAGGVVAEDRQARLVLRSKSGALTKMIDRVINAHFPYERDRVADATGDLVVELKIPREYQDNPSELIEQILHLYLTPNEPGFKENKAAEIIEALKDPKAPHRDLGLCLQGLGTSVLPDYIRPNYTNANMEVRFWCARAGAVMQDVGGMVVLQEIIKDPASPYRRAAIMAVIEASRGRDTERATVALMDMMRSLNTEERVLAYHALLAIRSHAITTLSVGKKFVMDILPADSPPMIYILESESPRIAFIGRPVELPPGATFVSHDKLFTVLVDDEAAIKVKATKAKTRTKSDDMEQRALAGLPIPTANAKDDDNTVTLYWRSPLGDKDATLRTVQSLPHLIARATWIPEPNDRDPSPFIGASYQRMAEVLAQMVADKVIDASIVVQHTPDQILNATDLALSGRAEGSAATMPALPAIPPAASPLPQVPDASPRDLSAPRR